MPLESLLDLPPQQVADTLNTLLSLSSPSQKMHWMEDDDFIQCEISYYFLRYRYERGEKMPMVCPASLFINTGDERLRDYRQRNHFTS